MIPPNDNLALIPSIVYSKISEFMDNIYDDITCDQDEKRKYYNTRFFNSLKENLLLFIKNDSFWKNSMCHKNCDHKFKSGRTCNKRIYICPDTKEFKCSKHISKKVYVSTKHKHDDLSLFCVSLNNLGKRCGKYKKYGDYCNYHITRYKKYLYNIKNDIYYLLLYDIDLEINILNQIYFEYPSEYKNKKDENIILGNYIDDMIKNHMDTDFLYNKYFIQNKPKMDYTIQSHVNEFNQSNKVINIKKSVNNICNVNLNKLTVKDCLNGGAKIINDKEYLKDIAIYDLYSGKKINTTKLINKYNEIKKMYEYIKYNNKFNYFKKNNKNKSFYIKEDHINILLEYINIRYSKLYDSLQEYEPEYWIHLLNDYKIDIDSVISDFNNIDNDQKIYI